MRTSFLTSLLLAGAGLALAPSRAGGAQPTQDPALVTGETASIAGGLASTWARVNGQGKVTWVGVTVPLSMAENQPAPGSGPAGAVAVLKFPPVVQQTTYFDHVEIHSNLHGHAANPGFADIHRYEAPHFDFHFYAVSEATVRTIPFVPPPLPPVASDRVPAGYAQPDFSVPQMGRHSLPLSEFTATDPWMLTMVAGFLPDVSYAVLGEPRMHFLEPMITRAFLLERKNFTLPVPMPLVLGEATGYPTEFVGHYDKDLDAYHLVFKGFESMN